MCIVFDYPRTLAQRSLPVGLRSLLMQEYGAWLCQAEMPLSNPGNAICPCCSSLSSLASN
ncbi:hypothetical protein [Escherichia coli]|uniref:hypothetical protein n=1 Tax=Escherichia coli TaxID=562 RepID=UPI003B52BE31